MTSHRSVPGFWGAEPHPAVLPEEIGLAWGVPPSPLLLWVWGRLGGSWGFPTLLLAAKALLRFQAGCEGNKGREGRGGWGAQFCLLSESNNLVQSPVSSLGTLSTPQQAFFGGTDKGSNNLLKKRGDSPQSHPRASWGCQRWVTGCPRAGTGAQWQ